MAGEQRYWKENGIYVYEKLEFPDVEGCKLLTPAEFSALPEYTSTIPTGVFVNKVWKAQRRSDVRHVRTNWDLPRSYPWDHWMLCEYAPHPTDDEKCLILRRPIIIDQELAAVATAIFWWL